jgi:enamine deaminase RidA (YjgF/YER057c/UK114 family)
MTGSNSVEARVRSLGLELPEPSTPIATYIPFRRAGNLLFLSGVPPRRSDNTVIRGCIGSTMTIEEGYDAARLCGLTLLANMRAALGSLDKVEALLKG